MDPDKREPVNVVDPGMDEGRMDLVCQFCKKTGACLQCSYGRCWRSYHGFVFFFFFNILYLIKIIQFINNSIHSYSIHKSICNK